MPNNLNIITINNIHQCSQLIRNYFINTYQVISTKETVGIALSSCFVSIDNPQSVDIVHDVIVVLLLFMEMFK